MAWSRDSTGILPCLTTYLGPRTQAARVGGHDLAGDRMVEEHAQDGQVLLDRGHVQFLAELLDVGGDMHRGEFLQAEVVGLAPAGEAVDRLGVGLTGVRIADGGGDDCCSRRLGARSLSPPGWPRPRDALGPSGTGRLAIPLPSVSASSAFPAQRGSGCSTAL
jgi:hypothetical protein